jgi:hypothetical protein
MFKLSHRFSSIDAASDMPPDALANKKTPVAPSGVLLGRLDLCRQMSPSGALESRLASSNPQGSRPVSDHVVSAEIHGLQSIKTERVSELEY